MSEIKIFKIAKSVIMPVLVLATLITTVYLYQKNGDTPTKDGKQPAMSVKTESGLQQDYCSNGHLMHAQQVIKNAIKEGKNTVNIETESNHPVYFSCEHETKAFLQQLADQQGYQYQPVVVGGKSLYQVSWN